MTALTDNPNTKIERPNLDRRPTPRRHEPNDQTNVRPSADVRPSLRTVISNPDRSQSKTAEAPEKLSTNKARQATNNWMPLRVLIVSLVLVAIGLALIYWGFR
jgi:hypothetical protein